MHCLPHVDCHVVRCTRQAAPAESVSRWREARNLGTLGTRTGDVQCREGKSRLVPSPLSVLAALQPSLWRRSSQSISSRGRDDMRAVAYSLAMSQCRSSTARAAKGRSRDDEGAACQRRLSDRMRDSARVPTRSDFTASLCAPVDYWTSGRLQRYCEPCQANSATPVPGSAA
jgi:hypothetical protein